MNKNQKIDGRDVYWCDEDYEWKYTDNEKPIDKIYFLTYYQSGEEINFQTTLTKDELKQIDEMTGGDSISDIEPDHPITIRLGSKREEREAAINGLMFGDGLSREEAEKEVDKG